MLEPTLTSQLLGAGSIAISFYAMGYLNCRYSIKKKQLKQAKINEMLDLQEGYEQEIKSSVWDDLATARKQSISDNNWSSSRVWQKIKDHQRASRRNQEFEAYQ